MSDINELNEKIAELEKQRDALAEKTGGFKVGDKVVIEGVVSGIDVRINHPIEVKTKGGQYEYFRPDSLRHAAPAPDASKRIAELEKQCEKIKAEAKRWKEAYQERAGSANLTNMATIDMVCDLVEARKEIEDLRDILRGKNERIDLLQDWLAKASAFKSKPTCDTTCDSPDQCCNTKPAKPATTGDGDCDSVAIPHYVFGDGRVGINLFGSQGKWYIIIRYLDTPRDVGEVVQAIDTSSFRGDEVALSFPTKLHALRVFNALNQGKGEKAKAELEKAEAEAALIKAAQEVES